jgi:hypothetical protein
MAPDQAAEFLGVAKKTLRLNHVEYGIDKSVALGPNEPRFFRSQMIAALKTNVIKGRRKTEGDLLSGGAIHAVVKPRKEAA